MAEGTIDEMMRDYAEAAVELARDFAATLDYSEASLQELERILEQLHEEYRAFRATASSKAYASEIGESELRDARTAEHEGGTDDPRQKELRSHSTKTGLSGAPTSFNPTLRQKRAKDWGIGQTNQAPEEISREAFPSAQSEAGTAGAVEEQMVMMCKLWGGYLGEVVRRRWGGQWAMETYPGADFATLTLNVRGAKLFPSMKIYRRLTEGEQDDVWSFYKRVKGKLG